MDRRRLGKTRTSSLVLAIVVLAIFAWTLSGLPTGTPPKVSVQPGEMAYANSNSKSAFPQRMHSLSPPAAADPTLTWTELTPPLMPPQQVDGAMVYDSTDRYVLLFGGENDFSDPPVEYNYTWTFSGGHWTNVTNLHAPAPSPRSAFGLADDPADHEVVLFGGYSAKGTILDDTWTYVAGAWTNITATAGTPPPATYWGSMTYDNQTDSVIFFGGLQGLTQSTEYTNETWSFSDNTWTELFPTTSPPARNSESMVDDVADGSLLLFGGQNASPLNDTWTFSGTDWSHVTTTMAPPVSWGAGLAYDAPESEVVLFGGTPAAEYQTWTYHAGTWTEYDPTPNPGQAIGLTEMTYDYADQYVLLFADSPGAVNSTWALTIASGLPPPALEVTASATPQTGTVPLQTTFTSDVSGGTPPYTITWSFGDSTPDDTGSPGVAGNTTHTYQSVGSFDAVLTVVDSVDAMVTKDWTITVSSAPLTLKIGASPTISIVNGPVSFTSTPSGGTPPYTYAWTFGDGGTASTRNATHGYASVGKFTAELVVHDNTGASTSQTVNVTVTLGTSLPTSAPSTSDWWIYLVIVIVVVIAIVIAVWYRRRGRQDSPAPPPPSSPSGPSSGGSGR
jgi:PKD repeat protein